MLEDAGESDGSRALGCRQVEGRTGRHIFQVHSHQLSTRPPAAGHQKRTDEAAAKRPPVAGGKAEAVPRSLVGERGKGPVLGLGGSPLMLQQVGKGEGSIAP